jgi:hypothetical protein
MFSAWLMFIEIRHADHVALSIRKSLSVGIVRLRTHTTEFF